MYWQDPWVICSLCRCGGGARNPHTCCQVIRLAASCALTSPPHPTPSESLPSWTSPPGEPAAFWSYLEKNFQPQSKQKTIKSSPRVTGFPWPLSSRSLDNPFPGLAPVPRAFPHPPFPADRVRRLHWGHRRPGPTYCAGAGNSWAGVASSSPTPRTTAPGRPGPGLPASAAGPPPASGPAVCPSNREGSPSARPPGKGLLPTKAPGREQEDAVVRSWLPGLLSKQNQRESRAARAWPGRVPYARGPGVGRAEPGSPNPGSAARCAPGRAAPRHRGRKSAAAGPRRRGRGARRGVSRGTYGRLGGCSRKVSGLCALGCSRLFSPRCSLARPPTRFPPARTALAPSARLRCGVNWNQSRRPRDSHNAQRAARHIPSRLCASGHPSRAAPALTLILRPRARGTSALCSLDVSRSVPRLHRGSGGRPCALKHPSLTLDARCGIHPRKGCALNRGAGAERLLQRTSQPVCLEWHLLNAYCVPGPQPGTFAASSLEAIPLTQGGRRNYCYQQALFPPQPMQTPAHLRARRCL